MKESKNQALERVTGPGFVDQSSKTPWGRKSAAEGMPEQTAGDDRPRTMSRMELKFRLNNQEFQDGAAAGDWTSHVWSSDI